MEIERVSEHPLEIWTIGHSTLSYESFVRRLHASEITAIADVRSSPFSRRFPHFNRKELREALRRDELAYVFLGKELGGRPEQDELYRAGVADYEKMARLPAFAEGLDRIAEGATTYRIALMCSEHDPLDCHRCLLVGRSLSERGIKCNHILSDGSTQDQRAVEEQLLRLSGRSADDFFQARGQRLDIAYRERSMKVAYSTSGANVRTTASTERAIEQSGRDHDWVYQEQRGRIL